MCDNYEGNGGTALALMAKTRRISIDMITDLDRGLARRIGIGILAPTRLQALLNGHDGSTAVIPNASMLVQRPPQPME